jgi:stage II sporulation protein D
MLKYKLGIVLFLYFTALYSNKEFIKVGIMHKEKLYNINIKIHRGTYNVFADNTLVKNLNKNDSFTVTYDDSLIVRFNNKIIKAKKLIITGQDYVNNLTIKKNQKEAVAYDDNLEIRPGYYGIQIINEVRLENYVAAVIEGEAGYKLPPEFYKLQAILSRTYALKNIDRHSNEGFSICDKVHCQVYHHKCTKANIYEATISTNSLVVVDEELNLINTIFHSNCGGQTCNSEDVWHQNLSYLRCVTDSFCVNSTKAYWKKSIPKERLNNYFSSRLSANTNINQLYNFCQDDERLIHNDVLSVKLTQIRRDLALRSTYFYIEDQGDSAVFYGRGYGHGVGLCQQGGIEMANQGYSYVDILKHYYQGILILNRKALQFFRE